MKYYYKKIIAKLAKSNYKLHNFDLEWIYLIFAAFIIKIICAGFSLLAGYFYLYSTFIPVLEKVTHTITLSVLALIALEISVNILLAKLFKFILRKHLFTWLGCVLGLLMLYSLSFYISTNGLAIRQSNKADASEIITDDFLYQKQVITSQYDSLISDLQFNINEVKKNNWKGKLNTQQLTIISNYGKEKLNLHNQKQKALQELKSNKETSISKNATNTTSESEKYYRIISTMMLLQVFANAFLMFSWSKIYTDNDAKSVITEDMGNLKTIMTKNMYSTLHDEVLQIQNFVLSNFAIKSLMADNPDNALLAANKIEERKQAGFKVGEQNSNTSIANNTKKKSNNAQRNFTDNKNTSNKFGTVLCLNCDMEFSKNRQEHKFCSTKCRLQFHKENNGFDLDKFLSNKKKN